MIADLRPYPEYRESGLPWLGELPANWTTTRTKTRFRLSIEKSGKAHGKELLSVYTHIGVRPRKDLEQRGNKASSTDGYWVVRKGDIIVNKLLAWMGAVGVSHFDGVTSPAYDILRSTQQLESNYYHHLFRTKLYLGLFKAQSRGIMDMRLRLYFDELGQIPLICPSLAEQAAIVRFLDWANGRLERAIRAKRKVIALLNEQKQAIIHRAVTRGFDPSISLKPSGIPWLGDIPQHWEARKLKFEMSFRGGGTPSKGNSAYWNGTIPWVSPKDMKSEIIHDAEDHITERAVAESSTNLVPAGSLLIVVRSGILQRAIPVARCIREVALNQDMKALTSKGRLDLDYFVLFIRGCEKRLLREWTKQGATVESVEHQYLANTKVPVPPLPEQKRIVEHLSVETAPLTTAISRLEREIELLREYRTRLVADVVSGKLDVREAAARLPEEVQADTVEDATDPSIDPESDDEAVV